MTICFFGVESGAEAGGGGFQIPGSLFLSSDFIQKSARIILLDFPFEMTKDGVTA